ncbi:hypothetical protein KZP23_13475 [Echinicola marina]|uniref:hypothetical protein n=1 Tax=Echinicola marina TaxID=2859768 RepID=UPI001CF6DA0A|nr:hypothetical protein [Echinicola marina]UCS91751.1 hypothetical protein KZP23_13475 [Echinicola marina]
MKTIRNIFTVASLVAIYMVAMTAICCLQSQETHFHQPSSQNSAQVDALMVNFNHAGPVKYFSSIEVPPAYEPGHADGVGSWAVAIIHNFQFECRYQRQLIKLLSILPEQKKLILLYPFHFFF